MKIPKFEIKITDALQYFKKNMPTKAHSYGGILRLKSYQMAVLALNMGRDVLIEISENEKDLDRHTVEVVREIINRKMREMEKEISS